MNIPTACRAVEVPGLWTPGRRRAASEGRRAGRLQALGNLAGNHRLTCLHPGREIPTLPQRIVSLTMINREHEGVTSQPGYTLAKPSNCPNDRDHLNPRSAAVAHAAAAKRPPCGSAGPVDARLTLCSASRASTGPWKSRAHALPTLPAAGLRDSHTPTGNDDDDGSGTIFARLALLLCKRLDSLSRGRRSLLRQAARNAPPTASAAGRLRCVGRQVKFGVGARWRPSTRRVSRYKSAG